MLQHRHNFSLILIMEYCQVISKGKQDGYQKKTRLLTIKNEWVKYRKLANCGKNVLNFINSTLVSERAQWRAKKSASNRPMRDFTQHGNKGKVGQRNKQINAKRIEVVKKSYVFSYCFVRNMGAIERLNTELFVFTKS